MVTNVLLYITLAFLVVVLVVQILSLRRKAAIDLSPVQQALQSVQESYSRNEQAVRQEIAQNRVEMAATQSQSREEMTKALKGVGDTLNGQITASVQNTNQRLDGIRNTIEQRLQLIQEEGTKKIDLVRQDSLTSAKALRDEVALTLKAFGDSMVKTLGELGSAQRLQLGNVVGELAKMSEATERRSESLKLAIEQRLKSLQEDNAKQLDQMRQTVDEKLQGTLEKRLGESFKQVSERLEAVYTGLGEMQKLATGVGDLKKVLTNVKTRGTWGEVQLGALLEQVLTPDQYETNVATKGDGERVEFAIKLPGRGEDKDEVVWLPIDAKFPVEDYQRLVEAQENADADAAEQAAKQLESRIKSCAWDICNKYLNPPRTTDFGILFLPTEGLFAEVARRVGLAEFVQRECRVVIAGPTTLWSILNSLQMGFRTLAIQKRSSEVWNLLAAVKTEWSKCGDVLGKVQKKLQEASNTIEAAERRTRAIGRKLKGVQELPAADAKEVLMLDTPDGIGDIETHPQALTATEPG